MQKIAVNSISNMMTEHIGTICHQRVWMGWIQIVMCSSIVWKEWEELDKECLMLTSKFSQLNMFT